MSRPRIYPIQPEADAIGRLWDALNWRYGPEHADRILAGKDRRTQDDIRAWRRVGAAPSPTKE